MDDHLFHFTPPSTVIVSFEHVFKPFQPSDAFYIETNHLICATKQMTNFYMKCNTSLK